MNSIISLIVHGNKGVAFKDVNTEKLYPAIGLKKLGEHVRVNFGQEPFAYDIDGFVQVRIGSSLRAKQAQTDASLSVSWDPFPHEPMLITDDWQAARKDLQRRVDDVDASTLHPTGVSESQLMQELVSQYLAHEGYTETTEAFAIEVKDAISHLRGPEAFESSSTIVHKEDPNAANRQSESTKSPYSPGRRD